METIVGIKFKKAGKTYYFSPGELSLQTGDEVVVETARGSSGGRSSQAPVRCPTRKSSSPSRR